MEERSKPRDVLKQYIQESARLSPEGKRNFLALTEEPNPNFTLFEGIKDINLYGKWDEDYLFKAEPTYYFQFLVEKQRQINKKKLEQGKEEYIENAVTYFLTMNKIPKIITLASATTDNIGKNVSQQFKFTKDPKTPIILIDEAFFGDGGYDFYKLLSFEEREEPSVGPREYVRFYRKKAGLPLTINPEKSTPYVSENYKKAYLEETELQAAAAEFDTRSEIEICCIRKYLDDVENQLLQRLKSAGISVYGWGENLLQIKHGWVR